MMSLYFLRKAVQSTVRSPLPSIVAVGTIATALVILVGLLVTVVNAQRWLGVWGGRVHLVAFFKEGVSLEEVREIRGALGRLKEIHSVTYVSKEEAVRGLEKELGQNQDLLAGLSANPLPASLELRLRDKFLKEDSVARLAQRLRANPLFEDIRFSSEWVRSFASLLSLVKVGGGVLSILVLLGTVFIVTNTIKLAVYARREEIEIMRLVGATRWFVRWPFLVEGMIQGLLGAGLALGVLLLMVAVVGRVGSSALATGGVLAFLSVPQAILVALAGVVLGLLGSFLSLGRFLKV